MISINVRHNFPEVQKKLAQLPANVRDKVMARSLNATMDQAKPAMAKQITSEFKVASAAVKERLEVTKAKATAGGFNLSATLSATSKRKGRSMNVIAFQVRRLTKTTAKRAGRAASVGQLGYQIKRAGGRKVITGSFIGNKGRTVFIRLGKGRLPIKAVNTIDIPQMFNTKRINQVVRDTLLANFEKNFARELRSVLGGWTK